MRCFADCLSSFTMHSRSLPNAQKPSAEQSPTVSPAVIPVRYSGYRVFTIKVLLSRLLCADRTLVSKPVLLPVFLDISRILRYNLLYNKCRNGSDTHLFSLMTVLLLGRFAAAKMPFLFILLQYFFHLFVKRWIHAVEMFRHIFMYRTFADPEFCSRAPYCRPIFHKIGSEDNTTFLAAGNIHQSRSLLSVSENCMLPKRRTDLF